MTEQLSGLVKTLRTVEWPYFNSKGGRHCKECFQDEERGHSSFCPVGQLVALTQAVVRAETLAEQRAREEMAVIIVAAAANAVVEAYADEPPEHQVMQRDMRAFIEGLPVSDEARRFYDEVTASFKERAEAAEARVKKAIDVLHLGGESSDRAYLLGIIFEARAILAAEGEG